MTAKNIVMAAAGARQIDPNDAYTSLVLMGEGNNGGQNNTFLDSSGNNLAITRYGNTTQGTFSPFSKEAGKWGVAFSVAGADYLSIANNTNLNLTGVSFTIEAFVNISTFGNNHYIVDKRNQSSVLGWGLWISPTGQLAFFTANGSYNERYSSQTIKEGSWNHVALVVSDTSAYTYINGIQVGSYTSVSFPEANVSLWIGRPQTYSDGMIGYISNLRITKGAALYTSNFTPSTTPFTTSVPSGTVSLLTCQDNRFKDNSSNNFTLTPYGDVKVTPFSPFSNNLAYSPSVHGGSGYFDGSGDYLTIANTNALILSGTSWTAECWVYTNGDYSSWQCLFAKRFPGSSTTSYEGYLARSTGYISFFNGGNYESTTVLAANSWNHCAWVYDGVNIKIYVNGVSIYSAAVTITEQNTPLIIGDAGNGIEYTKGYISNFRIIKGTALYTGSTITVPTAPLTAVTNTSLLCNFTNASIIDSTGKNNLETVGNAQVSTTTKKFGNGAMYFDGSGDWLTIPASQNFTFGTGDFTIECWIYVPNLPTRGAIISNRSAATGQTAWDFYHYNSKLYFGSTSSNFQLGTTTLASNTWYHVAVTRASGTLRLFVNGMIDATVVTGNTTNFSDATTCYVGAQPYGNSYPFNIDELRITKGKALYTTNFTPTSIANYY